MKKKFIGIMLATAMTAGLAGCGGSGGTNTGVTAVDIRATGAQKGEIKDDAKKGDEKEDSEASDSKGVSDLHIGIIIGSVSQSEDGRRSAEALQATYGEDMAKLAIYPDNSIGKLETTIQITVDLSGGPKVEAIIMSRSVPDTIEAFRKIKKIRPDIFCIAGKDREDLPGTSSTADLVCNNDFTVRGYLIIHTAHELGCDTFVHTSFPRHIVYETMSRRMTVMKEVCKKFSMKFVFETTPDPTSDVGVADVQAYILEKVPEWVEKYGKNAAYFCISDTHAEPLLKQFTEYGGYLTEADPPPLLAGYPGALGINLAAEAGDFGRILIKVESTVVERGDTDHFETQTYSYGYTISTGLAQHALNVLNGESELDGTDDIAKAYQIFSPRAEQNGSNYTSVKTDAKLDSVFLVYQGTHIMGDPGYFMGSTKVEAPEKYFAIK